MATKKRGRPPKPLALPDRWDKLSEVHSQAGALLREIVVARLEQLQEEIEAGEDIYAGDIRSLGATLKEAIAIEREALSMDYLDANRAVARVQQLNFIVTRPDGAIDVKAEYVQ